MHSLEACDSTAVLLDAGVSGCIVSFVAPLVAGSGIPEIKTYLNGVHIKGETNACLSLPCDVPLKISSLQSLSASHFSLDDCPPCQVPVYMAGSLGRYPC